VNVLTVNCGSSSLRFRAVDADPDHPAGEPLPWQLDGAAERIGKEGSAISFTDRPEGPERGDRAFATHEDATSAVLDALHERGLVDDLVATSHRVVHDGGTFVHPTIVDDEVMDALEGLTGLAPLHNRPALDAISTTRRALGPDVPAVAVFDTAFHHDLPSQAARYAIRPELADRHGVRRFGFHGLAHRWMSERFAVRAGTTDPARLITLQLGNGCSAAAIDRGRSIDTTMGLTPLEGLMMGTRSGDVDPGLPHFLAERAGVDTGVVLGWLNHESGLLGVSGRSADMRDLLDAEAAGDERAALAIDMFCYRVRKAIGAYDAALGGATAVVFGGGIGEHAPEIRRRICAGLEHRGLRLDPQRNEAAVGRESTISADGSSIRVEVVPVDEATLLALDAARLLHRADGPE
jgi:acetate kinase